MAGVPPLTAEDLALFRWIDHVRLSPAGDQVAYQLSWADVDARQNRSRLVVRSLSAGAEPQELPSMGSRDHSPEWSPDGARLAFRSRQGPGAQLFVIDAGGTGAQDLTAIPDGVLAARWSPDGGQLAFLALVLTEPDGIVDDPRPPGDEERVRRPPVARVVRRLDYKRDGAGYLDGRRAHLFVVSPSGGDPRQLTSGAWDVEDFDWAPDGRRLAVVGDADPDQDLRRDRKLYSVDLAGIVEQITRGHRMLHPAWSPSGDRIAFAGP